MSWLQQPSFMPMQPEATFLQWAQKGFENKTSSSKPNLKKNQTGLPHNF